MSPTRILALSGGVGGAKLALGLHRILPAGTLTIAVNTGDDFEHLGLTLCPDIDTALYTLGDIADRERGWGRAGETWHFMAELQRFGGPSWFQLGDRDLAIHIERSRRLGAGETLSAIISDFAQRLGIGSHIVPMTNDRVRTMIDTDTGELAFQDYFVRLQCQPAVHGIRFAGADNASPNSALMALLRSDELAAIVVCPSNPWLSIDPLLAMPALRAALAESKAPIVAVSPIIGGAAVKGPTAKIMGELGLNIDPVAIAAHYGDLLDGFVLDTADAHLSGQISLPAYCTRTWMQTLEDRQHLAREVLAFARTLPKRQVRTTT